VPSDKNHNTAEIKHDGFRIIARKSNGRVRLYSRPGNDFTRRFPLIVEALARLRSRSCIIDGEAVACDDNGVASFDLVRHHRANDSVFLYAFDLIELNGADLRRDPLEVRKATLASVLAKAGPGIRFNEHIVPTARPSLPMPARWGSKALSRSARIPPTVLAARPIGSR
jgi:bifunctional non-homologous end joining protein LigD